MNVTIDCGENYSPNGISRPTITDNEDLNPTVTYNDVAIQGCSLIRTWTAMDGAGNIARANQIITFSNPRPPVVTSPTELPVACGSIEDANTNLAHNNITVQRPCGRPIRLNYTDSAQLNQCGFTFSRVWEVNDDCGQSVQFTQIIRVLDQQLPDSPMNGLINSRLNEPLSWPQYPGASSYQLYVWREADDQRPAEPIAVTSSRQYQPRPNFYPPGTRMLWQVEYVVGVNMTIPSPVWGFETERRPDLEVVDVTLPNFAYSGQSFDVAWSVINSGNLSITGSFFYDDIYMSRTSSISDGRRVRRFMQRRFLDPMDGYNSEVEINLADDDIGVFYVFVITDGLYHVSNYHNLGNIC